MEFALEMKQCGAKKKSVMMKRSLAWTLSGLQNVCIKFARETCGQCELMLVRQRPLSSSVLHLALDDLELNV